MDYKMVNSSGPPTPPTDIEDDGGARFIGIESQTSTTTEYSSTEGEEIPSSLGPDLSPRSNVDICVRCSKTINNGLVIRFAQSYHSSCLEKTNQEGEEDKVIEFSNYVNLQIEAKTSGEEENRFPKDADLPVLGFPALTGRRNISSVSISSSTPPTPPTPVPTATTTSVEEPKASSPRGAAYLFQRVSKFRRKPSSKSTSSKDGVEAATTNTIASGKPPKSGGRASASLPSSASSFDLPGGPVNPVERRRAASLSVPQGVAVGNLPGYPPLLHPNDCGPLPNYQNLLLPSRSPPRVSALGPASFNSNLSNSELQQQLQQQQQPKIAFNQRSKHRDYYLVDYTAKETAQNLAGMSLDAMSTRNHHQQHHPHHLHFEQRHHFAVDGTQQQQQQQHYLLNNANFASTNPSLDENDVSDYSVMDFSSPPTSSSSSAARHRKKSSSISSSAAEAAANTSMPLSTSSNSPWSKSSKNTQSLDRSLKKSKGSKIFSRNAEYDSGPLSLDPVVPDSETTMMTPRHQSIGGTSTPSSDARLASSGSATAIVGGWLSSTFSSNKEKSAQQPIPSPKNDDDSGCEKSRPPSTGTTPPLSLSDPSRPFSFLSTLGSGSSSPPPSSSPISAAAVSSFLNRSEQSTQPSSGSIQSIQNRQKQQQQPPPPPPPLGSWNKYRPRSGKQYANTEMLRISIGTEGVPMLLSSSSSGSRERTNSSGTDQDLSPLTSLDNSGNNNNYINLSIDNNNVVMESPSSSLSVVDSSPSSISTSKHIFTKPLPVMISTSSSSTRGCNAYIIGGGSPHTQFEMDSLSPSGTYVLSVGGGNISTTVNQQQQPLQSVSLSPSVPHRLTLSNLGGNVGGGSKGARGGLIKTVDESLSSLGRGSTDPEVKSCTEDEEGPYLDMSITSVSESSSRSLIISQPQELPQNTLAHHLSMVEYHKLHQSPQQQLQQPQGPKKTFGPRLSSLENFTPLSLGGGAVVGVHSTSAKETNSASFSSSSSFDPTSAPSSLIVDTSSSPSSQYNPFQLLPPLHHHRQESVSSSADEEMASPTSLSGEESSDQQQHPQQQQKQQQQQQSFHRQRQYPHHYHLQQSQSLGRIQEVSPSPTPAQPPPSPPPPPPEVSEPALNYLVFEPGSKIKSPKPTEESVLQELEYYARLYGSRGPPMSAAAFKATSNSRSSGGRSSDHHLHHQQLPQVPEIPSTDDEEINSSSSSSLVTLDAVSFSVASVSSSDAKIAAAATTTTSYSALKADTSPLSTSTTSLPSAATTRSSFRTQRLTSSSSSSSSASSASSCILRSQENPAADSASNNANAE